VTLGATLSFLCWSLSALRQDTSACATPKKQDKAEPPPGFSADFSHGLEYRSESGDATLHAGGRWIEHVRAVLDRPEAEGGPAEISSDVLLRRALRLQLDGTIYKEFSFVLEGDFPSRLFNESTTPPSVRKAYVAWSPTPEFSIRVEHFKMPNSQDRLNSLLFIELNDFSDLTRFVPGYDWGVQVSGSLCKDAFTYALAVSDGLSSIDSIDRYRLGESDGPEGIGRVTLSPFTCSCGSPLAGLRLGIYGSLTEVDQVALSGTRNFQLISTELGVKFLTPPDRSGFLDGQRFRIGGELSYVWGPLGVRAEFLHRSDQMTNASTTERVRVTSDGWYAALSWIATGEDKAFEKRLKPSTSFDPTCGGWGAVELAARVGGATVSRNIETVLGTPGLQGQSNRMTALSGGVNWWLLQNLRISADVIREDFHDSLDFGGGQTRRALLGFVTRFQVDF
jgi:phosphate-selective porin OprO/OprP